MLLDGASLLQTAARVLLRRATFQQSMETCTMTLKQTFVTSAAVVALSMAGAAFAEQPATPMVSGDEPMEVGDSMQLKAPDPMAAAQEKTEKMLKEEAGMIGGDTNPVDEGDAAEIKEPK
jgi:hypothetical protein